LFFGAAFIKESGFKTVAAANLSEKCADTNYNPYE